MVRRAYSDTTTNIYKTMGDLSSLVISHMGQIQFTEADNGISVQLAFQKNNRWNHYRFVKQFDPDKFVREYRDAHPKTTIDSKRRALIIANERNRIGRVLYHFIKNLFVAIDDGIIDLGEAFMPFMVLPDGSSMAGYTLYEALGKPIEEGRLGEANQLMALNPTNDIIDVEEIE